MINKKRNGDIQGWLNTAEKQFEALQKQLEDPNVDELDKIQIQDDIDTLITNYQKYSDYGGFTKPKKGKAPAKIKLNFSAPDLPKMPKISSPSIKITPPKVQKITASKTLRVKLNKINLKKSISTIPGAKRLA